MAGASTRIRLYPSGILFSPFAPRAEDIRIEDVAHGLACTNVAHHSLLVADLCPERPLWGLLHEVAEALSGLGDVCGPTKRHPSMGVPMGWRDAERAFLARFALLTNPGAT